jgi:hypothetical protein
MVTELEQTPNGDGGCSTDLTSQPLKPDAKIAHDASRPTKRTNNAHVG